MVAPVRARNVIAAQSVNRCANCPQLGARHRWHERCNRRAWCICPKPISCAPRASMTDSPRFSISSRADLRAIPRSSASPAAADNGGNHMGAVAFRGRPRAREPRFATWHAKSDSTPRGIGRNITVQRPVGRESRDEPDPAQRRTPSDDSLQQRGCRSGQYLNACQE